MKSERHQTWHGDRGPRVRSCTSKTFGGLTHRGRWNQTTSIWNPHNSITPLANPTKFQQLTSPETGYKLCKFCENRARNTFLRGVYIPHFVQISVKNLVLGVLYPNRCTDGGEIWHAKFHPHRYNVSPLRGEKPRNRPLSNLNTVGLRCAQCCR